MEFRPFWELLEQLGITLPNPEKIKKYLQNKPANASRARSRSASSPSNIHSTIELLRLLDTLAVETEEVSTETANDAIDYWVPPGKTVEVAGYQIPGMVYVGEGLSALRHYGIEPCLIRPSLKVNSKHPDSAGKHLLSYAFSYTQMQASGRAAYLQWLAAGRCDPQIHSGYIWLFFYGLERRVFHDLLPLDLLPLDLQTDLQTDQAKSQAKSQEFDQIIAEVKRLQAIYGGSSLHMALGNKIEAFLKVCQLIRSPLLSPGELSNVGESALNNAIAPLDADPFTIQLGLGQKVKQGQPISADWALAWYVRLANNALPTAAARCLEEFKALFQLRYGQEYGEGLKLKPGKVKLKTSYYPSNPSFGRSIEVNIGDLPDVSRFTAKLNKISELVQQCRLELDPLSRWLARNPDGRDTLAAVALLPPELLATHGGDVLKELQHWLTQCFTSSKSRGSRSQVAVVSGAEVLQHWAVSNPEKLTKAEASGLSRLLAHLGYGMEPDPCLGGALPSPKNSLALFRLPADLSSDWRNGTEPSDQLSAAYFEATLLVHLAIAVASGTEPASLVEQHYLATHWQDWVELKEPERSRLLAHLDWLLEQNATLRSLKKARIEQATPERRGEVAQFLVQVAAADAPINPKEVQLLEKAYTLLGLDPEAVYRDIHSFSTAAKPHAAFYPAHDPVTVRHAAPARGHKLPPAPKRGQKQPEALALDMTLVQSKLTESQEISNLLAEIFVDEAGAAIAHPVPQNAPKQAKKGEKKKEQNSEKQASQVASPAGREIAGLDVFHSALLLAIAQQVVWQRQELEAIAARLNLMLDGALEMINEAAFDRQDAAVIEGDDPMEVNVDVLQELLA